MTHLHWSARAPRKPGWYWTRVLVDYVPVTVAREVYKSDEHGLMIRTDPGAPHMSMALTPWATNWSAHFAGPISSPPEV